MLWLTDRAYEAGGQSTTADHFQTQDEDVTQQLLGMDPATRDQIAGLSREFAQKYPDASSVEVVITAGFAMVMIVYEVPYGDRHPRGCKCPRCYGGVE